jgi:NTE family protein
MRAGVWAWLAAAVLAGAALPATGQTETPEPAATPPRPRIGLVLSGGGARGFAHLGVLRVLQDLRVPVDCVAGTSMGALVGGAISAGIPTDELILRIGTIDWNDMLVDSVPRPREPERVRREDALNLFGFELGLRGGQLLLPSGTASGYKLEFFLRALLERAGNFPDQDFDQLALPFRAIATNLENGEVRVFARGDLVRALRASMSVPGAFAPTEIDGTLYVDGGLVDNLPVNVARATCADVVIAVNLGSPLLKRSELNSIIGVGLQTINLLTEQNVRASLASLKPTDILIEPALGDFSAANFAEALAHTVPIGEAAARAQEARLAQLSLPPSEYAQWRKQLLARIPQVPPVTGVEVATTPGGVSPLVIEEELRNVPGIDLRERKEAKFDPVTLSARLTEVYGRGDFDSIGYSMVDRPSGRIALINGLEKNWGPDYLKFGLALARDDYQSTFNAALLYRMTWLTRSGTEWRNLAQVGYNTVLSSEVFQPLGFREGAFIAPKIAYEDQPKLFFSNGTFIGQYDVKTARVSLDVGTQNHHGEVRAGLFGGRLDAQSNFGVLSVSSTLAQLAGVPSYNLTQVGYTASATYDQLDSLHFPRHGELLSVRTFGTVASWGSDDQYNRSEAQATVVRSIGPHSLQFSVYGGVNLSGTLPPYDVFEIGGLLRGSGFNFQELFGENLYMARSVYTYRYATLPPQLGRGLYLGGSLEVTRAQAGSNLSGNGALFRPSASVFFGADTIIGPLWLAWGQTFHPDSRGMWYLLLGSR